jgi:hypothetical protein
MAAIFLRAKMPRGQARRLTNRRRSGKAALRLWRALMQVPGYHGACHVKNRRP